MRYGIAIFDLDGTLLDTLEDLKNAVNAALGKFGYPERTAEEVRGFVGSGMRRLIELAIPDGAGNPDFGEVFDAFNIYYKAHCTDNTRPYEGITALLARLREDGVRLAVVSNKSDYGVQALCRDFFGGMIDYAAGLHDGIRRKPYPDSVNEIISKSGMTAAEAIYIGDSEVDIETARNAGIPCISVIWGFRDEALLRPLNPDYIVSEPEQLSGIISGRNCEN